MQHFETAQRDEEYDARDGYDAERELQEQMAADSAPCDFDNDPIY